MIIHHDGRAILYPVLPQNRTKLWGKIVRHMILTNRCQSSCGQPSIAAVRWQAVPDEVFGQILSRLYTVEQLSRACAACSAWSSAVRPESWQHACMVNALSGDATDFERLVRAAAALVRTDSCEEWRTIALTHQQFRSYRQPSRRATEREAWRIELQTRYGVQLLNGGRVFTNCRAQPPSEKGGPEGFSGSVTVDHSFGGCTDNGLGFWRADASVVSGHVVIQMAHQPLRDAAAFWQVGVNSMGQDQFLLRVGVMPPNSQRYQDGWWIR